MKQLKFNFAGRSVLNFVTTYLGWWACVLGASQGYPLIGPLLAPLWVGLHLYFSPTPKGEVVFLSLCAVFGFVLDAGMIQFGVFTLATNNWLHEWPTPWLVTMWILFAMTFESMLPLRRNLIILCVLGALSGPLSYYAGEAFKVLQFSRPLWIWLTFHAAVWALVLPILFLLRDYSLRWGENFYRSTQIASKHEH